MTAEREKAAEQKAAARERLTEVREDAAETISAAKRKHSATAAEYCEEARHFALECSRHRRDFPFLATGANTGQ